MGRKNGNKLITVIAAHEGPSQSVFTLKRSVLCISPVLKDYLEHADTIPPKVGRNGEDTLTFNTTSDVLCAALDHLKWIHDGGAKPWRLEGNSAVFYVQLYKMALCFGLEELRAATLKSLQILVLSPGDFLLAAIEASRLSLIGETRFRAWFTSYIQKRHEDLLKPLNRDDDAAKLCSILVSTVALFEPQSEPRSEPHRKTPSRSAHQELPITPPPSTPRKARRTTSNYTMNDAKKVHQKAFETEGATESNIETPIKTEPREETLYNSFFRNDTGRPGTREKKRKHAATVQDATDEDDLRL